MHFVEAKGILSAQNGMNLYRGCTHGCIYCDSRSKCYQFTHPFEDIEVKENAPRLLEKALRSRRKKCMIGTGAMCDPYMHCEEELGLTRRCLEIIDRYGFGVVVQMTLTTYDENLCRILEPNVSTTAERVRALEIFRDNGIPTVVWLSPILPFINDTRENIEGILGCCVRAKVHGILCFGMGMTLREGDREYFYGALDRHFPGLRQKYHHKYGYSYELKSDRHEELMEIFRDVCRRNGIVHEVDACFQYLHEFPEKYNQLTFF